MALFIFMDWILGAAVSREFRVVPGRREGASFQGSPPGTLGPVQRVDSFSGRRPVCPDGRAGNSHENWKQALPISSRRLISPFASTPAKSLSRERFLSIFHGFQLSTCGFLIFEQFGLFNCTSI
jgi:hypothetical protein